MSPKRDLRALFLYGHFASSLARVHTLADHEEMWIPDFDVDKAADLYVAGMVAADVATAVGTSRNSVVRHLKKRGIVIRSRHDSSYRKHSLDEEFFSTVDPLRAYWAGFIAADGHMQVDHGNKCVKIGLHPQDREMLDRLRVAAQLDQPVTERRNGSGALYVYLDVYSIKWVNALRDNFNIQHGAKSHNIRPPSFTDEACVWSFIRGFFDGDGGVKSDGRIDVSSATKSFIEWIVRDVFKTQHAIGEGTGAWRCAIGGPELPRIVRRLYEGSTPETRLDRKYQLLKSHLVENRPCTVTP